MLPVTIGAYGGVGIPSFGQLTVDPVPVIFRGLLMALSAHIGDVEVVDRRIGIPLGVNPVGCPLTRVAIIAGGCGNDTAFDSSAVNAALIYAGWMVRPDLMPLYQIQIRVAAPAGFWKVDGIGFG